LDCIDIWIRKIEELIDEIEDEYKKQRMRLSDIDKSLQTVLHELERVKFNVVNGYYLAKRIQDLRMERRSIKNDLEQSQRIYYKLLKNSKFNLYDVKERLVYKKVESNSKRCSY
jgi:hypothetical protein